MTRGVWSVESGAENLELRMEDLELGISNSIFQIVFGGNCGIGSYCVCRIAYCVTQNLRVKWVVGQQAKTKDERLRAGEARN